MITAHEALNRLNEEDAAQLVAAEARIDATLDKYDGKSASVCVSGSRRVLAKVLSTYGSVDWTVGAIGNGKYEFTTPGKVPQ